MAWLCRQLGVARSGFYAWQQRLQNPSPRAQENTVITAQVQAVFERHRGFYGAPRIHQELKATGLKVGRHRVARLMPGVNYVGGSRQLRRRVARPSPPAMAGGGDIEN